MSDTNEHRLSLSYQIRRAIKAEDELQVAQAQVKLLTDQWNALPIKELVVNADYREMWQRQLKMNQQLIASLSAEKQAQPERAPSVDKRLLRLQEAVIEMYCDWKKGDFALPRLAQLDLEACFEAANCGEHFAAIKHAQPEQVNAMLVEDVNSEIVKRYKVEKTKGGFWPYCVKAGDGTMDLFIGSKRHADHVQQAL